MTNDKGIFDDIGVADRIIAAIPEIKQRVDAITAAQRAVLDDVDALTARVQAIVAGS